MAAGETSEAVIEAHERTRAQLLDALQQRAHDVHSLTRAAVLKAWATLVANAAVNIYMCILS